MNSANDPPPPHFKHLSLLTPPHPPLPPPPKKILTIHQISLTVSLLHSKGSTWKVLAFYDFQSTFYRKFCSPYQIVAYLITKIGNCNLNQTSKGNYGFSTSQAQMKEHEISKRTSYHWPSYANWFLRYQGSKSQTWTSPFSWFQTSFQLKWRPVWRHSRTAKNNKKIKV